MKRTFVLLFHLACVPQILTLEAALKRLKTDLNDALGLIQYPKDLKRLVMDMGTRHLSKDEDVSTCTPVASVVEVLCACACAGGGRGVSATLVLK